jgi:DNA-binding SARP family transcriptional activator
MGKKMIETAARTDSGQKLHVSIIGTLTVRRGSTVLAARDLGGPKPRQILEFLLLNLGIPVSKARLIDLLWGSEPPREAVTSVESYISVLRRRIQPGHGRTGPLRTATGGYLLDEAQVDLDISRFDALIRQARRLGPEAAHPILVEALSLATGPLLGDELSSGWAEDERRRHAASVTGARVFAAETANALGLPDEGVRWAREALHDDQLNEGAWTALVEGMEHSGRYAEGLKAFAECRRLFHSELGCEPGSALREAHRRLLTATAGGSSDLSEAVSALLILHERLLASRYAASDRTSRGEASQSIEEIRHAGSVITSFLRRASEAA